MSAERRRHPRVEVDLLVQYRADTFEEFLVAYCTNLSESGLYLASPRALPAGAIVHFQLVLRDGVALIEGLGRVQHAHATGGMGIVLEAVDEAAQAALRGVVEGHLGARASFAPPPRVQSRP
jgi:hypothetical protein